MRSFTLALFAVFFSSVLVWADPPIDLSSHGTNLKQASFVIRYKFEQKYKKSWQASSYAERKKFLTDWYVLERKKHKAESLRQKEEARKDRELQKAKKAEQKRLNNLAKGYEKERLDEQRNKRLSKKHIDRSVKDMERELRMLRKNK